MKRMILAAACLLAAACGASESSLREDLNELAKPGPAMSVTRGQAAYDETKEFVAKVEETFEEEKETPRQLLIDARELQKQRAVEYRSIVIEKRALGSVPSVMKAVWESGAPVIDLDWGSKNENKSSVKVDPTRDTTAKELSKKE